MILNSARLEVLAAVEATTTCTSYTTSLDQETSTIASPVEVISTLPSNDSLAILQAYILENAQLIEFAPLPPDDGDDDFKDEEEVARHLTGCSDILDEVETSSVVESDDTPSVKSAINVLATTIPLSTQPETREEVVLAFEAQFDAHFSIDVDEFFFDSDVEVAFEEDDLICKDFKLLPKAQDTQEVEPDIGI